MNSSIIHVGYPKTATTWFQNHFYANINNYNYIARPDLFKHFIEPDIFTYNASKALENLKAGDKPMLVCEELLMGGIDIGFGNGSYLREMALRLKATFPNPRIVLFLRNQVETIASWYYQYVRTGGSYSPKRFLFRNNMYNLFYKEYDLFSFKLLEYDKIIDLYTSVFGTENVDIYLYEDLDKNGKVFFDRFIGIYNFELSAPDEIEWLKKPNRRYRTSILKIARFVNMFTYKNHVFKRYFFHVPYLYEFSLRVFQRLNNCKLFGPRASSQTILGKSTIAYIEEYYKESNRRSMEKHKLHTLKDYGYPL